MIEPNLYRKNKINLADYDFQKDIQNRLIMSRLSVDGMEVLEELLYSPPRFSVEDLYEGVDVSPAVVDETLSLLAPTGLFEREGNNIIVNKDQRKYFESQMTKFEEGFVPGMEYLQSLLRKVPIHVLPQWYPIPRTSNNIFDSLVEKFLQTPQIYQRYLLELNLGDDILSSILQDVLSAPNFEIEASELKKKYSLSDESFEELALQLEFNFVCCVSYRKTDSSWKKIITPFQEWGDYLRFIRESRPQVFSENVQRYRPSDFSFIDDLTALLEATYEGPIALQIDEHERWIPSPSAALKLAELIEGSDLNDRNGKEKFNFYISQLIKKSCFLRLARIEGSELKAADEIRHWLDLSIEQRALSMYRHTITLIDEDDFGAEVATDRNIKEIEKSLGSLIGLDWVLYDDFLKGLTASLSEESRVTLKKVGRYWRYALPPYTESELALIRKTIMEWLFEAGIVAIGTANGKPCFRVTPLGEKLFSIDV